MTRSWDGASRKKLCTARASRQAGTTLVTKKQARALLGPAGQQPTVVARARAMPVNRPGLVNGVSLAAPSLAGPRRRPMSTQGSPPGAGSDAGPGATAAPGVEGPVLRDRVTAVARHGQVHQLAVNLPDVVVREALDAQMFGQGAEHAAGADRGARLVMLDDVLEVDDVGGGGHPRGVLREALADAH
eukprot:CAMPEP_0170221400 /NCGR_PEP_ID=MMETSP0116_2-20130129/10387_1 /TAXON_ID=400756 /ORGANISM="Durinskia baltica, Strain CSIRO CS-38" /LENGTH=186 /DNA_ID=CAMNT_0010472077 /DNA_START=136 /DNA_END=692 /DNA_ORIENTATION=+